MLNRPEFEKKQIIYVFAGDGQKISFHNDNVVVKDKEGKTIHQSTCYRLHLLCIVGNATITSGLLQRANRFKFTICLMTQSLKVYQVIGKRLEGNTLLHRKQYAYDGISIGQAIICNKTSNQAEMLARLRGKTTDARKTIASIRGYAERASAKDISREALLGYEGNAAREYFEAMFGEFGWEGRIPRIKKDYINATLDIGYTVLFNFVESLLSLYDFDLYCGVLHTEFYMRKSLVCDLMEPLRPIVDHAVRVGINRAQIKESDFRIDNHRYVLEWEHSKRYTQLFLKALLEKKTDTFLYVQNYYRMFMKGGDACNYKEFQV